MRLHRGLVALLAIFAAMALTIGDADARMSRSFGSRGARTYAPPPVTRTAPRPAQPFERTMTQPSRQAGSSYAQAQRPFGGLFGGGLLGGLAAGFLGAGLFGLLFGHGFFAGMGGFASFLGLLLQIALVIFVARLAWAWWQRRNQPAMAGGPSLRDRLADGGRPSSGLGGFGGLGASSTPLEIKPDDFNAFERLLGQIQTAYSNEDLGALRTLVTPEMASYYAEELAENASRGQVNRINNVKLLQGDLAEAWREGSADYATVAMRYSLEDSMVDRASGRVVQIEPSEATELWTFRRVSGGQWILSAIQQT